MRWKVKLCGITWDDGKGEYDVSDLPKTYTVTVIADDEQEAVSLAMDLASDDHSMLIEGTERAVVELLHG